MIKIDNSCKGENDQNRIHVRERKIKIDLSCEGDEWSK